MTSQPKRFPDDTKKRSRIYSLGYVVTAVRTDFRPDNLPPNTFEPLDRACTNTSRLLDQLADKPLKEWTSDDDRRFRRAKRSVRLLDEVAQLTDFDKARTDPATISRHLSDLNDLAGGDEPSSQPASHGGMHQEDKPAARQPWYHRLRIGRRRKPHPRPPTTASVPVLQHSQGLCLAPTSRGDFCRNPAGSCPHHRR